MHSISRILNSDNVDVCMRTIYMDITEKVYKKEHVKKFVHSFWYKIRCVEIQKYFVFCFVWQFFFLVSEFSFMVSCFQTFWVSIQRRAYKFLYMLMFYHAILILDFLFSFFSCLCSSFVHSFVLGVYPGCLFCSSINHSNKQQQK